RDKVALVEVIFRALERVGAGGQIERGANRADSAKLRRNGGSEFAGHLRDEVAAHRIAREENPLEAVPVSKLFENRAVVAAHARVVERGRQPLGAAAIALIEPHDVKAAPQGLLRDAS